MRDEETVDVILSTLYWYKDCVRFTIVHFKSLSDLQWLRSSYFYDWKLSVNTWVLVWIIGILRQRWSDKGLKGTVVNRACFSLYCGSFKITLPVPLNIEHYNLAFSGFDIHQRWEIRMKNKRRTKISFFFTLEALYRTRLAYSSGIIDKHVLLAAKFPWTKLEPFLVL